MAAKKAEKPTSDPPQILLKADTVTLALTGEKDGKIRLRCQAWEEPVVILAGQRLEVQNRGGQVVLLRLAGGK